MPNPSDLLWWCPACASVVDADVAAHRAHGPLKVERRDLSEVRRRASQAQRALFPIDALERAA